MAAAVIVQPALALLLLSVYTLLNGSRAFDEREQLCFANSHNWAILVIIGRVLC